MQAVRIITDQSFQGKTFTKDELAGTLFTQCYFKACTFPTFTTEECVFEFFTPWHGVVKAAYCMMGCYSED